jgi:hypothetical protein
MTTFRSRWKITASNAWNCSIKGCKMQIISNFGKLFIQLYRSSIDVLYGTCISLQAKFLAKICRCFRSFDFNGIFVGFWLWFIFTVRQTASVSRYVWSSSLPSRKMLNVRRYRICNHQISCVELWLVVMFQCQYTQCHADVYTPTLQPARWAWRPTVTPE